jgi:hypothetical protein
VDLLSAQSRCGCASSEPSRGADVCMGEPSRVRLPCVDASPVCDAVGYYCVSTCGYRRGWPGLGLRQWLVGVSVVRLRHLLRKGNSPQFERAAGNRFHRLCRDERQGGVDRRTYAVVEEPTQGCTGEARARSRLCPKPVKM